MVVIALFVIGAAAIIAGTIQLLAALRMRRWPVARGRIEERSVGPSTTTGASRPGRYFEPRVRYSYSVEGKTYAGHRISPATAAYDEGHARRVVDKLPDDVDVRYNPRDPADAYLRPTSLALALIVMLVGWLVVAASGAVHVMHSMA
jgi:Protein of unknown function (DUF3592)